MDMPQPTDKHRHLERLTGTWRGQEKMHPSPWDPKGSTAEGRTQTRLALGGFAAIGDYEQRRGGQVTFSGHSVFTYNQQAQCYELYWFDCMGMPADVFRGEFTGERLVMTCQNSMGNWRLTYDFGKDRKLTTKMESSTDGKAWSVLMDGVYARE